MHPVINGKFGEQIFQDINLIFENNSWEAVLNSFVPPLNIMSNFVSQKVIKLSINLYLSIINIAHKRKVSF